MEVNPMSGGLAQNPQGFGGQAPGGLGNNIFGGASPAMQNPMTQALQRIFSGLGPQGMPPPVMGYPSPRGVGMQTPPGAIPR